jgi:futalosine hydrolase
VLVTGVGSVATAFYLGEHLLEESYDIAVNLGITGSFDDSFELGEVVCVQEDRLADLGAEKGERVLDLKETGLQEGNTQPFQSGPVRGSEDGQQWPGVAELPQVKGITVNTTTGTQLTAQRRQQQYQAEVETMEGAAFFHTCEYLHQPCLQIRSISNYIGERQFDNWHIKKATHSLNEWAIQFVKRLAQRAST